MGKYSKEKEKELFRCLGATKLDKLIEKNEDPAEVTASCFLGNHQSIMICFTDINVCEGQTLDKFTHCFVVAI